VYFFVGVFCVIIFEQVGFFGYAVMEFFCWFYDISNVWVIFCIFVVACKGFAIYE